MSIAEWFANMETVNVKRSQINQMIMEYLIREGYKGAAEKFKSEAGFESMALAEENELNSSPFDERIRIREAIEEGKIKYAVFIINHFYPELIDQNRDLYFKLKVKKANGKFFKIFLTKIYFCFYLTATTID